MYCGHLQHSVFHAILKKRRTVFSEIARPVVNHHIVSGPYRTIVCKLACCAESAIYCFLLHFKLSARFLNSGVRGLMSFCSCLRLFTTTIFPSINCLRRAFLGKTWRIQLPFLCSILCRMILLDYLNTSFFTRSFKLLFLILFQRLISKLSRHFIIYSQMCSNALGMG